jgi:phosphoribosylanthranilate isomerase
MRDPANVKAVAETRPDFLGFIFFRRSPRYVGDHYSETRVMPGITNVGVFVNDSTADILNRLNSIKSKTAQLHGSESPEQCTELQSKGVSVIKAFSVDDAFDFSVTKSYTTVCDYFLFDTKGKLHGGNAVTFNWKKLKEYDQSLPFFLSGGLKPDNLDGLKVLEGMNLFGLDFNSGVEIEPGMKDVDLVSRITNGYW